MISNMTMLAWPFFEYLNFTGGAIQKSAKKML